LKVIWAVPVIASILILGVIGLEQQVFAPKPTLEISPDTQSPGKKFRMNDPLGRFLESTITIFKLGGVEKASVDMKEVAQGKKAQGTVPDLPDDTYTVFAYTPGGTFEVDTLTVNAPPDIEPPIITASTSPAPNANGWNNTDVVVSFGCVDNEGGSGVASVTGPILVSTEGAAQGVIGTCTDVAGNSATVTVFVSIDKTGPTGTVLINGGDASTNSRIVTLTITCLDFLSGYISMQVAVDGTVDTEPVQTIASSIVVILPAGDGTKTVAVILIDIAGNLSAQVTDSIVLDTTP